MPVTKERRPRVIQACNSCRAKKYKCDGHIPCSHCRTKGQGRDCVFQGELNSSLNGSGYSLRYVKQLEKSLEMAEAALVAHGIPHDKADPSSTSQAEPEDVSLPSQQNAQIQSSGPGAGISPTASRDGVSNVAQVPETNEDIADSHQDEIMDINGTTGRFEFHGQLSSLAFLNRLMKIKESNLDYWRGGHSAPGPGPQQIVSVFQNEAFSKQRETPRTFEETVDDGYYPLHAFLFIDSYFKTLHYVHPILDQSIFIERCHSLWTGHGCPIYHSFKVLYFAVLSLGALTRTWSEGPINGMDRYTWTRVLFEKAELLMGRPGALNNLEAVQASIIMAQVCQHQLNPNLAYTYLGNAVRTAFSVGINRLVQFQNHNFPQDSASVVVSRTWWALYSLETESSFTLGRPDILGLDCCHNRPPPPIGDSEIIIIPAMLGLSQIMREISKKIYWEQTKMSEKLQRASKFERDLDNWLAQLPPLIRPNLGPGPMIADLRLRDHYWPKLQMLVLKLRYLHARIVLFYLFFLHDQKNPRGGGEPTKLSTYAQCCKDAAVEIIKSMHLTYCVHHFYRSWWNNTTYITFGLSILLSTFAREPAAVRSNSPDLEYINQALEMLGVMQECLVARNIENFVRELVDTLLATEIYRGDEENGQQKDAAQLDLSMLPADGTGRLGDFDFDFNAFNFFDANFPMMFDEVEQDVGFQTMPGIRQDEILPSA